MDKLTPATIVHPHYSFFVEQWKEWRSVYEGGCEFIRCYLEKFSNRESQTDFDQRKKVTPTPAFAKAAVNEIKNSIFQRLVDVKRVGGSKSFIAACKGENGGVDGADGTMNWFIGEKILPELLTMKKVGLYIDNGQVGPTLADSGAKPYMYIYKAEDIRAWKHVDPKRPEEFQSLLLRDHVYIDDPETGLPIGYKERFRHLRINDKGKVSVQFYDEAGEKEGQEVVLNIKRIPFVVFEISDSLLKDVSKHQIALLNLDSSDIGYILKSNFPFYTEQKDSRNSMLVKAAQAASVRGLNDDPDDPDPLKNPDLLIDNVSVGTNHGRYYDKGMERPGFISPPTEPLKASMEKQEQLKNAIRTLVHLALSNLQPKMASAESKQLDMSGLESGLSYIGLELEHGENLAAVFWSLYEGRDVPATKSKYPEKWSLKTETDKRAEVKQLTELRESVPSITFKKQINIQIIETLLSGRIDEETLSKAKQEVLNAEVTTGDHDTLRADFESGIISGDITAKAMGYPDGAYASAKKDHAERLARIKDAQTSSARGVDAPSDTAIDDKDGKPKRGEAE